MRDVLGEYSSVGGIKSDLEGQTNSFLFCLRLNKGFVLVLLS